MKSLLIIFAALQLFIQHREVQLTPNDYVFDKAMESLGKQIGNGECSDLVEYCLDASNPNWRLMANFGHSNYGVETDSVLYLIYCYGRQVSEPSMGDIVYFFAEEEGGDSHVGILESYSEDEMTIIDQNSCGTTIAKRTNVKCDRHVIFFRPI